MKLLRHSEFIEKFERYSAENGAHKGHANYCLCHWGDPRIPELGHLTHEAVLRMSSFFNMVSMDSIRADLLARFRVDPIGKLRPKPKFPSKAKTRKLLEISGLNWFEVNGQLAIHWNEKETKAVPV